MYSNHISTFLELVKLPPDTELTFCKLRYIDSQTIITEAKHLTIISFNEMYAQF